ncbi:MAG: hypothetical protein QUU85_03385, partial [Candidatus Eisenbacteria bacterium]|nr:hypothetical protein [Candidatus Eisenbacteria bacterium]
MRTISRTISRKSKPACLPFASIARFLLPVLVVAAVTPAAALQVETEVIHNGFIWYYDLGVDSQGFAHAYLDDTLADLLYYRTNLSGSWSEPILIDHTSDWGSLNVSGTVDAAGKGHVAYDGGRAIDDFFYATNRSGSWVATEVRPDMRWFALDLGPAPAELPRCAYYDNYSGLNYGVMAPGGNWNHVVVDGSGEIGTFAGRYPDLVVDPADHGHIAYYFYEDQQIRYATDASGAWQWEPVASAPGIGNESWLALDASGAATVCYQTGDRIWIARKSGGTWVSTAVTPPGSWGYGQADVDIATGGLAVVAYDDVSQGKLMLAVETAGGFVAQEVLDSTADGEGPVLEVRGAVAHLLAWNSQTNEVTYVKATLDLAATPEPWNGLQPLLTVLPHPVRDQASLMLRLPEAGSVTLTLVDPAGRQVGSWRGVLPAGQTKLAWEALV